MNQDPAQARGPISWMARNIVAANILMAALLGGGFVSFLNIRQEVFPNFDLDTVTVSVAYPGASPEEVEQGIVLAIEEAVAEIDDIKEVISTAGEGFGRVRIEMLRGGDLQQLAQDIQSRVDSITTFPVDAEQPEVSIDSRRRRVIELVLYGPAERLVLHELAELVRRQLLEDPEITQVEVNGLPRLEISIEVPQEQLRRHGLTLEQIAARLRQASTDLPAGGIRTRGGEVLVRMTERRDFGEEFARTPILIAPDGTQVLLGDIAEVRDEFAEDDRSASFDGQPAVMLEIFRVGDQTPASVAAAAREQVDLLQESLPEGIQLAVLNDWSVIFQQRANLLLKNGAIGLIVVFTLLGIFLEMRLAFWVMLGIPISFLGSMLLVPGLGVSINMVSMFAYLIALGIVVDDAIVVGENIYHHHQEGLPFRQAAILGAREVAVPVTFSVITNMVAFAPLLVLPGVTGKIFSMIPLVVIAAFFVSLIESLFVLPAHLGHQRDRELRGFRHWLHARQQAFSHAFTSWVRRRYAPFLDRVIAHPMVVVLIAVSLLTLTLGYVRSGRMGFQPFPRVESDFAFADITLPFGAAVEDTHRVADQLFDAARKVVEETGHNELVKGIFVNVGDGGSHRASVRVQLAEPAVRERTLSTAAFVEEWRSRVGPTPGVDSLRLMSDRGGPGGGAALTLELRHPDIRVLEAASAAVADELSTFPNVLDIDSGFQPGKPQIDFRITPEGEAVGLTALEVARQVRHAFFGVEVVRQQRGRHEVRTFVRLPLEDRRVEHSLEELMLRTPSGAEVPLREVVVYERGRAYTTINRRDGARTVTVSADVNPRPQAGQVMTVLDTEIMPELLDRFPGLAYSYEGRQAEDRRSMGILLYRMIPLSLLAIYALLAIPFRSYIQPLIILSAIPFGFVGAVIGHLIMGYSLSLIGFLGMLALCGVVVNDSLVLIDFANRQRRKGMSVHDAIVSAGVQRFRPILLTTLSTFGGLAPMIFETSRQARFLIPMAISLGYGLLFATLINLILVPALYKIVEDVRAFFHAVDPALEDTEYEVSATPEGAGI